MIRFLFRRRLRQSVLFGGLDFPYALFDGYSLSDV